MKKTEICFINGANPNFLGGISLYQHNLIKYLKSKEKNSEITWVYESDKNESYKKDEINYVGIKVSKIPILGEIIFNKKARTYLQHNYFDIINSHAIWGYWMKNYKRQGDQILINTYHGVAVPYYKTHLRRFGIIKKIFLSPLILYGYLTEKPPIKKADKIICISEKVRKQIEDTYWKRKNIFVVRTGVNLSDFKLRNKNVIRKELKLDEDKIYGLCVGRGGYWIKGLDRAIKISKEIYKLNKKFRLIVIGSDKNKVQDLLDKEFIIYLEQIPREKIPFYYNSADFLFVLSRYEGGAPTLVVSEAMASGCPVICSKDSQQEIIENKKNGLTIDKFDKKDAKNVLELLENKRLKEEIIKSSIKTIKDISLEKWGREYLKIILSKK